MLFNDKKRKIKKSIKWIFVLVIIFFIGYAVFAQNINKENYSIKMGYVEAERLENSSFDSEEDMKTEIKHRISEMIENASKSVVGISKLKDNGNAIFQSNGTEQIGIGTGIIVSKNGYILTNEHVSGTKGSTCYVTVEDGKQYGGNVVWSDFNLDLSIIKVNMKFIDVCKLGDSNNISVGECVYAIGNPVGFEFQRTVTSGIVSALDRTIVFKEGENEIYLSNLIQTDAIINPGNSGGPLINENGEVLGINTVKLTSAEGIGFAIPINVVKPIIEKFEKEGKFEEAQIGIFAYDKNVIPYLNTGIKFDSGIYVAQISLDSPTFQSGLQVGDVITQIDDVQLNKMCDLREYIYKKNVGDRVKLNVVRNRKNFEIEVELINKR